MSLLLVRPGRPMVVGMRQLALYALLSSTTIAAATLTQAVPGTAAWWDAGQPGGLLGAGDLPLASWNVTGNALRDFSGNGRNLLPFSAQSSTGRPQGVPHLSGLLGGAGYPVTGSGLLQPALDPATGWQVPASQARASSAWALYLVWSRPNWRQGTGIDTQPITLLSIGSQPVLQVDSKGGSGRLVLFPGSGQFVASTAIVRRHTHSILIRYSPTAGADLWLDHAQVAHAVPWSTGGQTGPVLLLHNGATNGAAQCWLHEAAEWTRSLSDADVEAVLAYAGRWVRGPRKGIYLLFNGQSNAINYTLNDGAGALLARGIAWHTGALACNVLATTGAAASHTMASGHGIYATSSGYPGSFVSDPGDGSDPSTWALGPDGFAVQQAVASLPAEDRVDIRAIIWPWNETDSLRTYSERTTFRAAALRYLSLLRTSLGDADNRIPLIWWNPIPYGTTDGMLMHREVVESIAADQTQRVVIGNIQTSDSNPRGSSWDPATGIVTGGDFAHRDGLDNQRFARLASPIVARALVSAGFADSFANIPNAIPRSGGPTIVHAYRQSSTTLVVTIAHDAGTDLKIPRQAASGAGFAVMDGGTPANPGTIVPAVSCARLDATHLLLVLQSALRNASAACRLYYPYGSVQIGRGNAVTDNFSGVAKPDGWNAADLGTDWDIDCPLAATFSGITLSDTYL
ncbi:MAG: hypothetical protein ACJ8AW_27510 [Rhodopila sp.]